MALVEMVFAPGNQPDSFLDITMLIWGQKVTYKNRGRKVLTWFFPILILNNLYILNPALAQPGRYNDWHMGPWMTGGWEMGWFGFIFMIVFWGLIIVGLVLLIRWLIQNISSKSHSGVGTGSKAMDILKERYARGEIKRDEFESIKKDLLQ